jgi:hypothetical protein
MNRQTARWLLLLPFAGTLVPPLFARSAPQLGGFPFFYWYLLAWVVLSAIVTGGVYLITREPEP